MATKKRTEKGLTDEVLRLEKIISGHHKTIKGLKTELKIMDLEARLAKAEGKK